MQATRRASPISPRWPTKHRKGVRSSRSRSRAGARDGEAPAGSVFVPFSAYTRMSGLDLADGTKIRKGAPDSVLAWIREAGGTPSSRSLAADRAHRAQRRHAAAARSQHARHRRNLPQGHSQAEHDRALRPPSRDGDSHGHDHRRQSAYRGDDREGSRRRRLSSRGHARDEDGADQARADVRGGSSP